MSIPERLSAFVILVMLLLAACEFNPLEGWEPFGPTTEHRVLYRSIAVEGFVLSATDSTAIEGASVRSWLPLFHTWAVYVQNHIDQDSTGQLSSFL